MDGRQPPPQPPQPEKPSSALSASTPTLLPVDAPTVVKTSARPSALVGVRIPSRNQHTRDLVVRVYEENPHLQRGDLWAVTRYAELSWKFRRLAELMERLPDGGFLRQDMEPRKILGELRALSGELLRHEQALGLTASARASLGINVARLTDLASAMSADGEDVTALEQRIIKGLSQGGGGSSLPLAPASPEERDS